MRATLEVESKPYSNTRSRLYERTCLMHFHKGMKVVIKSNLMGILILFILQ